MLNIIFAIKYLFCMSIHYNIINYINYSTIMNFGHALQEFVGDPAL